MIKKILILILLFGLNVHSAVIIEFTPNTRAKSSQVNKNFNNLNNELTTLQGNFTILTNNVNDSLSTALFKGNNISLLVNDSGFISPVSLSDTLSLYSLSTVLNDSFNLKLNIADSGLFAITTQSNTFSQSQYIESGSLFIDAGLGNSGGIGIKDFASGATSTNNIFYVPASLRLFGSNPLRFLVSGNNSFDDLSNAGLFRIERTSSDRTDVLINSDDSFNTSEIRLSSISTGNFGSFIQIRSTALASMILTANTSVLTRVFIGGSLFDKIDSNILLNVKGQVQADSFLGELDWDSVTNKPFIPDTAPLESRLDLLESDSVNTENRLLDLETDSNQTQIKLNDLNNQVNNINQDSIVLINFSKIVGDTITSDSAYSLFLRNDVEGTIASRLNVSDTVNAVGFVGNGSDITGVMHTGDTFTSFITIPLRITESAGSTSSTTFVSKSQNLSNIFFNNWFDSSTVLVNDPDSITLHYSVQLNAGATNQIELEARVSANGIIYSSDTIASVNGTPADTEIDIKLPISALSKLEGTDCRIRVSSGTGTVNYILHSIFMRIKYYKILGQ